MASADEEIVGEQVNVVKKEREKEAWKGNEQGAAFSLTIQGTVGKEVNVDTEEENDFLHWEKEEEESGIGNEEHLQQKFTLKKLYGSNMVSSMSGIDAFTYGLTFVCTWRLVSVYTFMDEKLSGKVDSDKLRDVANFFFFSLKQTSRNSSSEDDRLRFSFCARYLRNTVH